MKRSESRRVSCFRRGCLRPFGACVALYLLWSLWTGWLGPDRIDTWGTSVVGQVLAWHLVERDMAAAQKEGTSGLVRLLNRPAPRSLERPSVGSDDPEVAAGRRLPREMDSDVYHKYREDFETLISGDYVVRNFVEYRYLWQFRMAEVPLTSQESPEVFVWMASRADVLPPRRVDTLIYRHTGTFVGHVHSPEFWASGRVAWRHMVNAKNPYCRLRAIQLAQHCAEDWPEEREVYLKALQERDETFISNALHYIGLRGKPDPEVLAAVERLANGSQPEGVSPVSESIQKSAAHALGRLRERQQVVSIIVDEE